VCDHESIVGSSVKVNTQIFNLGDNVTDLRLDLKVKRLMTKNKHVVVCLRKLNSGNRKKEFFR
jgi:hypothetical protein